MGQTSDGRYYEGEVATDEGDATFTALAADANGTAFSIEDADTLVAELNVSAMGGSGGSLDVKLQGRVDSDDDWIDIAAFAQVTAVDNIERAFPVAGYKSGRWVFDFTDGTSSTFTGTIAVNKIRS